MREAFKNLGVEAAAEGDDILLRIGRGPDELFVREAVGATPAVNKEDAPRKSKRMRFVLAGATGPDKPVTTKQARESLITRSKGPARASDVTGDALELLCRNARQEAFELALDTFARVVETARTMVEEQVIDLALIEAQRMEIDRKQAENWKLLRDLVGREV